MKDNKLQTHQVNVSDTKILLRQNLLFDTNSLINIINYKANDLLNELTKTYLMTFTTIHPVLVELNNTDNSGLRTQRQLLISEYNFEILQLEKKNFDYAREIQVWDSKISCFPAPTDLYLGSVLYQYSNSSEKIYLLSGDLKDFPRPLLKREGHVILFQDKSSLLLTLLSIDMSELVTK